MKRCPPLSRPRRRANPVRLTCEVLEGRALLAASLIDSSFGTSGTLAGATVSFQGSNQVDPALAVQADGKLVTAEVFTVPNQTGATPQLVVRRYATNGKPDTAFGAGGQTVIPLPSGFTTVQAAPRNLALLPDGSIALAVEVSQTPFPSTVNFTVPPYEGLVARLTASGQLDSTFGANQSGTVVLPTAVTSIVAQPDGKVVVAGTTVSTNSYQLFPTLAVTRLTTSGALDATFGTKGELDITPDSSATSTSVTRLLLAPSGRLYLDAIATEQFYVQSSATEYLIGVTPAGALDPAVGTTGIATINTSSTTVGATPPVSRGFLNDAALQSNGDIVGLATTNVATTQPDSYPSLTLVRYLPNGTLDPTFAGVSPAVPRNGQPGDSGTRLVIGTDDSILVAGRSTTYDGTTFHVQTLVDQFHADGTPDAAFGRAGRFEFPLNSGTTPYAATSLALGPDGRITLGGRFFLTDNPGGQVGSVIGSQAEFVRLLKRPLPQVANDYDGDGRSDLAAVLPTTATFAIRPSSGTGDTLQTFGLPGLGQTVAAPGDYDGDGKTDVAAYLPSLGILAYRPSGGGADVLTRFGPTGVGNAVPSPGDYDGDGKTDVALFLPGSATFIVDPSGGGIPYAVQFGSPGSGNSIPAPGDYDGSGKTEFAVYLPSLGVLAYRPAGGGVDVAVRFGPAGTENALPVPGDYDGDGRTDVALYDSASSTFIVDPSGGGQPYAVNFGIPGASSTNGVGGIFIPGPNNTVPAPGDYDGDGRTDIAVFLPGNATYAIAPSGGGLPYAQQFGLAGPNNTIPTQAVVNSSGTLTSLSLHAAATEDVGGVPVYLPEVLPTVAAPTRKKTTL